jgi:hypothetical protein
MTEDELAEQMAQDIWDALEPFRHYHDDYDEGMSFDKMHEKAELQLMAVLEKCYNAGFAAGVADERMIKQTNEDLRDE